MGRRVMDRTQGLREGFSHFWETRGGGRAIDIKKEGGGSRGRTIITGGNWYKPKYDFTQLKHMRTQYNTKYQRVKKKKNQPLIKSSVARCLVD